MNVRGERQPLFLKVCLPSYRGCIGKGGGYPPSPGRPAYAELLSLTASATFNGICSRHYPPPTALGTSSNRLSNRFWNRLCPFPSNASLLPTLAIFGVLRLAMRRDQNDLGPPESDVGRSWLLLSSRCDSSGCCSVAHGTELAPNETQFRCQTLVACLTEGEGLPFVLLSRGARQCLLLRAAVVRVVGSDQGLEVGLLCHLRGGGLVLGGHGNEVLHQ